jgi:hypothetical protein
LRVILVVAVALAVYGAVAVIYGLTTLMSARPLRPASPRVRIAGACATEGRHITAMLMLVTFLLPEV